MPVTFHRISLQADALAEGVMRFDDAGARHGCSDVDVMGGSADEAEQLPVGIQWRDGSDVRAMRGASIGIVV